LDFDSEGLMLLTNNGELAQAMLHPRYHVPKTYLIKVKGVLTADEIRGLEQGVRLEDGMRSPAQVKKVRRGEANSGLEITVRAGRKHQVKRMLDMVGHPVIQLLRIRMGSLSLGELQPGAFRFLTDREDNTLRRLVEERVALAEESVAVTPVRPARREGWARAKKNKSQRRRGAWSLTRKRAGREKKNASMTRVETTACRPDRGLAGVGAGPSRPRHGDVHRSSRPDGHYPGRVQCPTEQRSPQVRP